MAPSLSSVSVVFFSRLFTVVPGGLKLTPPLQVLAPVKRGASCFFHLIEMQA